MSYGAVTKVSSTLVDGLLQSLITAENLSTIGGNNELCTLYSVHIKKTKESTIRQKLVVWARLSKPVKGKKGPGSPAGKPSINPQINEFDTLCVTKTSPVTTF